MKMKKYIKYLACALLVAGLSSCEKEEIGGMKVKDMAGEWYVGVDYVDEDMNVLGSYGFGYHIYTFNTAADLATEMYVADNDPNYGFYGFKIVVNVDLGSMTFSTNGVDEDYGISILDGKIVKDGTTSYYGDYPADSISFIVSEEYYDEEDEEYYTDYYWYHGYRRTGLVGGYD